jgi:hypothetical protein
MPIRCFSALAQRFWASHHSWFWFPAGYFPPFPSVGVLSPSVSLLWHNPKKVLRFCRIFLFLVGVVAENGLIFILSMWGFEKYPYSGMPIPCFSALGATRTRSGAPLLGVPGLRFCQDFFLVAFSLSLARPSRAYMDFGTPKVFWGGTLRTIKVVLCFGATHLLGVRRNPFLSSYWGIDFHWISRPPPPPFFWKRGGFPTLGLVGERL